MLIGNRLVGAIGVFDADQTRRFTASDERLLILLAQQSAIAVENARLYGELQRQAVTDPLTGMYNRRGLFQLGERQVERVRRFGHPLAAIMLDIDHFKQINDTFSHAFGDQVLRALADRCRTTIRETDILGRYGGEEFALLLPETNERGAFNLLTKITEGTAEYSDLATLERMSGLMKTSSLCCLGRSASIPFITGLNHFRDEYLAHIREKKCPAGLCRALITFSVTEDQCRGCTLCRKVCPAGAVSGEVKKPHLIDAAACIKCGASFKACKFKAIKRI